MWKTKAILGISVLEFKLYFREPQAVVFTVFFPLFLLILFMGVFGGIPGYINALLPGLVTMVIGSTTFFGVGVAVAYYRYGGVWKTLLVAPLPIWVYVGAIIISRVVATFIASLLLLLVAYFLYNVQIVRLDIFCLSLFFSILSLSALGALIASLSRSGETSNGIASLFFFPMLFLSGAFFPLDYLPDWVQIIARYLPLSQICSLLRDSVLGNSLSLFNVAGLFLWTVISLVISNVLFQRRSD